MRTFVSVNSNLFANDDGTYTQSLLVREILADGYGESVRLSLALPAVAKGSAAVEYAAPEGQALHLQLRVAELHQREGEPFATIYADPEAGVSISYGTPAPSSRAHVAAAPADALRPAANVRRSGTTKTPPDSLRD